MNIHFWLRSISIKITASRAAIAFTLATLLLAPSAAFASYLPGQTLNPSCTPTDPTCVVVANTAGTFVATSTSATSTFAGSVAVSGNISVGSLSGILKAVGGVITTALVNLSSDVTGILGITNGGTGTSTAPTFGQILVGNGSGGYSLIATSSLGISGSQWMTSSSNIYYTTGSVGIGTTSPSATLAVNGSAYLTGSLNVGDASTTRSNLGLTYANNSNASYPTYNIATWGDSLTAGNEDGTGVTYPGVLSTLLGRLVYNGGVGGQTSTQIEARMVADTTKSSWTVVIWAGRNNYSSPSQVEADIASMVSSLGSNSHYLILSVLNGNGEPSGTSNYNQIISINSYLAATYPGHYFDIREWLVQNGLSQAGIATSTQDQTDYGNDVIPTDLRYDGVHLNSTGYTLVAQQVGNFITTYLDSASPTGVLTPINLPSIFAAAFPLKITGPDTASTSAFSISDSAGNSRVTVLDNGNVGIGTSTPYSKLDVFGTSGTTNLSISNNTNNNSTDALALVFRQAVGLANGGNGVGGKIVSGRDGVYGGSIYSQSSNMQFYTAYNGSDTERMRITFDGKVGIGTSTPYSKLEVWGIPDTNAGNIFQTVTSASSTAFVVNGSGLVGVGTSTPGSTFSIGNVANFTAATSTFYATGGLNITGGCYAISGTCITGGSGSGTVNSGTAGQIAYYSSNGTAVSGSSALSINGSNIGIGTSTPIAKLDVFGGSGTTALNISNNTNNNSTDALALVFRQAVGTANSGNGAGGQIVSGRDNVYGGAAGTQASNMQFLTTLNGVDTEKMRITYDGKVSIGTSTPYSKLEVWGIPATNVGNIFQAVTAASTTALVVNASGNVGILTASPSYALDVNGTVRVGNGGSIQPLLSRNGSTGGLVVDTNGSVASNQSLLSVRTNGGTDVLTVFGGGNIGIGTTSPSSRLTIWGPDTASTSAFAVVNSASTTVFAVYDSGNATYSGSIYQSSDQRLKTDVLSLDASSSLAAIEGLNPVSYIRIDQNDGTNLGFIAQQVATIFPELVSTTSPTALTPDGTLTLNYVGLIAPIVKSIQALDAEITSLEQTVAGFAQSFTTNILTANTGNFQKLCVQKSDGTSVCVTGDQLAAALSGSGQQSSNSSDTDTQNSDIGSTTAPIIQVNGDNPAIINVGDAYSDLGATITGPTADLNLGIQTLVGATPISQAVIDTSAPATYHIYYVATDQNGLTSTSTRTVVVQAVQTDSASSTDDTATTTAQ